MSYSRETLRWNSVDVRGADGLLHLGRVVDCSSEGLMVDFRCGTAAQLVPFGQIYGVYYGGQVFDHEIACRRADALSMELPVDVLLRLSSKEAAKWYPAILLTVHQAFALVRATTPNGTLVEMVPIEHVRRRCSEEELREFLLVQHHFVKEEIQLPSGISSGSPCPGPYKSSPVDQHLVDCFNKNCSDGWMMATHIDGGVLHVLKICDGCRHKFVVSAVGYPRSCPEGEELLRMLGVMPDALVTINATQHKRSNDGDGMSAPKKIMTTSPAGHPAGHCQELSDSSSLASTSTLDRSLDTRSHLIDNVLVSAPVNNVLPKEILTQIFGFLDGTEQVKLRRVCSSWNSILKALPIARVLSLSGDDNNIILRVGLVKCWTAQTRIIVKTNSEIIRSRWNNERLPYDLLMCSGRLFCLIMQEHHLSRLETLLLTNISWEWYSLSSENGGFGNFVTCICQELNFFASVCHSLVLKEVTVVCSGSLLHQESTAVVQITKGRIEGELSVKSLWNRMDSSLPHLTDGVVDCWNEAIADGLDGDYAEQLVEILDKYQSADPRDNNPFCGREWYLEDLADLDLKTLSRTTLHSLVKACCNEKPVFVLAW